MCDPVSLTVAATIAATAGQAVTAWGNYSQAKYEEGVAENNAAYARTQARDAMERGQDEVLRHYMQVAQLKGEQQAAMGASGVDVGFGTPAGITEDTTFLANQDARNLHTNYAREKYGHTVTAQNYQAQARAAGSKAKLSIVSGLLNTTSTALGGASQTFGAMKTYGAPSYMGGSA